MNISELMRGLLGETKAGDGRLLELKAGQIVRGVIVQTGENGEALVQMNGVQVRAKLAVPLPAGTAAMLQVQPESTGSLIVLRPAETAVLPPSPGQLKEWLQALGLPDKEWAAEFVRDLRRDGLLTREHAQALARAASFMPPGEDAHLWMRAAAEGLNRGFSLTPSVVAALRQALYGQPVHALIAQLESQLRSFAAGSGTDGTEAGVAPRTQGGAAAGTGRELPPAAQRVLALLAEGAPLLRPPGTAGPAEAYPAAASAQTSAAKNGSAPAGPSAGSGHAAAAGLAAPEIAGAATEPLRPQTTGGDGLGRLLKWLGVDYERQLLFRTPLHGAAQQAAAQQQQAAGHAPQAAQAQGAATPPQGPPAQAAQAQGAAPPPGPPAQAAQAQGATPPPGPPAQAAQAQGATPPPQGLPAQAAQAQGATPPPQGLPAQAAQAQGAATPPQGLPAQAAQAQGAAPPPQAPPAQPGPASAGSAAAQAAADGGPQPPLAGSEGRPLVSPHTAVQSGLLQSPEPGSAGSRDALKGALLSLAAADGVPSAIRETAQQLVQHITGQQLLLSPERNGAVFTHAVLFIPLQHQDGSQTASVHVQTRRGRRGELDAGNCRLLFDLRMKSLGDTIVDVQIVERIVSLTLWNDHPLTAALAEEARDELASALERSGYQLLSMRSAPLADSSFERKEDNALSGRTGISLPEFASRKYKGVDYRV